MLPYIKYIEALILSGKSPEACKEALEAIGLVYPEKAFPIIWTTIQNEYPEYFPPESLPPQVDVLQELGILEAWAYLKDIPVDGVDPRHFKGALDLQDDPTMKRLVTALALAKIEDEDIELLANGKFNISFSVENIKLFLRYFFNIEDWTHKQRKEWVQTISDSDYRKYYEIALTGEKEYLMWKLGVNPDISFSTMLNEMKNDSFFNFKEAAKIDSNVAQRWAAVLLKVSEKMDKAVRDERGGDNPLDDILFTIKVSGNKTIQKGDDPEDFLGADLKHFTDL